MLDSPAAWSHHLRELATPALAGTPLLEADGPKLPAARTAFIAAFRDDAGHRRAIDEPFLAHLLRVEPGPPPATPSAAEVLWWSLHDAATEPSLLINMGDGPLIARTPGAIEVWTEEELSALHALTHLAARRRSAELHERTNRSARWLIENVQPDNATNHPWAIHCFVRLALARSPDHDARLYAETLLHNAIVGRAHPDRFSACILLDAANMLTH